MLPGLAAGILAGALAIYVSYAHLKQPQNSLDWAALIVSGLTVGIIAFFIVWGHFQDDPVPEATPVIETINTCPVCGGPVESTLLPQSFRNFLYKPALVVAISSREPVEIGAKCTKCDWKKAGVRGPAPK